MDPELPSVPHDWMKLDIRAGSALWTCRRCGSRSVASPGLYPKGRLKNFSDPELTCDELIAAEVTES